MAVVRWTLYDPTVPETWTFPLNPSAGASVGVAKTITKRGTTASGSTGRTVLFEGQRETKDYEFQGSILTQQHLLDLVYWTEKEHQVLLTDDLGRQLWIYLIGVEFTRQRSATVPWRHEYTLRYIPMDNP